MFKIPFVRNEGKWHEVNCSAENIPLDAIRNLSKKAKLYLEEKWHITTIEGMYYLTQDDVQNIPSRHGQREVHNLWELLKKKIVLHEKHFRTLIKLRESNHRYNGEEKRALLGIALMEPLIKKDQLRAILRSIPGFEAWSPGKKKTVLKKAA